MKEERRLRILLGAALIVLFSLTGCATPLEDAASEGDQAKAERLIKEGADVNDRNRFGLTPLHLAAAQGNKETVALLIAHGANVNAKDHIDRTPLDMAAVFGNMETAALLIAHGADVNAKDGYNRTPLDTAKWYGKGALALYLTDVMSGKIKVGIPATPEDPKEVAAFETAANNYRAQTVKPAFPEEARRFKVQAEAALKDKQFAQATDYYASALKLAPWWPEGHFNRALVLGELNRFEEATREMKRYLRLVPDAPNARAAQDKIYDWERYVTK